MSLQNYNFETAAKLKWVNLSQLGDGIGIGQNLSGKPTPAATCTDSSCVEPQLATAPPQPAQELGTKGAAETRATGVAR